MKSSSMYLIRMAGVLIVLILTSLACGLFSGPTPAPPQVPAEPQFTEAPVETQPPPVSPAPTEVEFTFTLTRQNDRVSSGAADPLQPLSGGDPQPFPEGFLVLTDATGEGLLQGILEGKQCRIFVFSTTRMLKKACPRATFEAGNISCVEEGSAVFSQCSNMLVTTASGALQLVGSYVMVTYLPGPQVSVFTVSEGEALVRPVTDAQSYRMGNEVRLAAGQFYYTAPDAVLPSIPDLPAREPLSIDRLPALLQQYDLSTWIQSAADRAGGEGATFPNPELLYGPPDLVVAIERSGQQGDGDDDELANVPIRVIITNRGGRPADIFKFSVLAQSTDGNFARPFRLPDQEWSFNQFTSEPLLPGGQVVFEGSVGFSRELQGEPAQIQVLVDSCEGDEFMPVYCRVEEFEEGNNLSNGLEVTIP